SGRAALLALGAIEHAASLAGVPMTSARDAAEAASRHRTAAIEAALSVVSEALADAGVRGDLAAEAGRLLARVVEIWAWSGLDEQVEHFAVDRLAAVGWDLYRERRW